MSAEENKAIVRRYLEDAWNNGNVDAVDQLFVPELAEGIKQQILAFRAGFPDWHCEIDDFIVEGDKVVNRWTGTATHTGTLFGIPPTGKKVTVEGITIHRIQNGKITNDWSQGNQLQLMQQLGVVPAPGQ
jgi:steroid delta-isomerase-like uncharacterized protein